MSSGFAFATTHEPTDRRPIADWPRLYTERLALRPATVDDLPALMAAAGDARIPADLPLAQMARENRLGHSLDRLIAHPELPPLRSAAKCAGCRTLRWSRPGIGKQGGARVIYFTLLDDGELCMLLVYPKAARDTIPGYILKQIRKEIEDGQS